MFWIFFLDLSSDQRGSSGGGGPPGLRPLHEPGPGRGHRIHQRRIQTDHWDDRDPGKFRGHDGRQRQIMRRIRSSSFTNKKMVKIN